MDFQLACSNFSRELLTTDIWTLAVQFEDIATGVGIVQIIFMLIGIPWNLIVIGTILYRRLFLQPAVLLLLNLAINDFLLCAVSMPFNIIPAITGEFALGSSDYVRCQVCQIGIVMTTLLLVSVYNIALLSLDRFLYVKKPLKYEQIVTVKRVGLILVVCWALFGVFSLLPLLGVGEIFLSDVVSTCTIFAPPPGLVALDVSFIYLWVFIIGSSALPVIVLLVTNTWMLCIVSKSLSTKHRRARSNSMGQSSLTDQIQLVHRRAQIRLTQVFVAVYSTNILTWVPTVISVSLVAGSVIVPGFIAFGHLSLLSQAVIHPIFQAVLLRDVRMTIMNPCRYCIRGFRNCFGSRVRAESAVTNLNTLSSVSTQCETPQDVKV